ncbi:MAG TPA: phosphomannose isomerase type II C-terminal cupin domain [Nocardioidaceae bacterium]|nr:phosphomannose isomerase type II C-terminal cupin domain [Nocardioidaceae bacterium]
MTVRDDRPWGCYEILHTGERVQVKRICVRPGRRLSYQRHEFRAEHWFVVSGVGLATLDGREFEVVAGSSVDVPVGTAHRIANPGGEELVFVEVQTGSYLGEDDIERLADDYGRLSTGSVSAAASVDVGLAGEGAARVRP